MNRRLLSAALCLLLAAPAFAAKGPQVALIDNKLSIDADTVPLARLLRLLDFATGMKSKVPPELANRSISVKFSGLSLTDGVRKIFQGQPLDYVVIEGQGVIVTAASQNLNGTETVPAYAAVPGQPEQPFVQDFQQPNVQPIIPGQPAIPGQAGFAGQQQQQPPTLQTPFGPVQNPRAQPNSPLSVPGQNSLFSNSLPQPQNNGAQPGVVGIPNAQTINPAPFGTASPFGTPQQNSPSNVFGNNNLFPGTLPGQPPHQ
jgi:hypothetical protein